MNSSEEALLLRIFFGEEDSYKRKALYEQAVLKAKELNLAGATVIRGIMGFGAHRRIHTSRILELSEDLPIIVELVDTEENLNKILTFLGETVKEGPITIEKAGIIKYRQTE